MPYSPELPVPGFETKELTESELIAKLGTNYAEITGHMKMVELGGVLSPEQKLQLQTAQNRLLDAAALVLPRIKSGELQSIGAEYRIDDPQIYITLFGGTFKIPVSLNALKERIPQIRDLLSEN